MKRLLCKVGIHDWQILNHTRFGYKNCSCCNKEKLWLKALDMPKVKPREFRGTTTGRHNISVKEEKSGSV